MNNSNEWYKDIFSNMKTSWKPNDEFIKTSSPLEYANN